MAAFQTDEGTALRRSDRCLLAAGRAGLEFVPLEPPMRFDIAHRSDIVFRVPRIGNGPDGLSPLLQKHAHGVVEVRFYLE